MLAYAVGLTLLFQQEKKVIFADPRLNLQFDHAASWTIIKPVGRKNARSLTGSTFNMPIDGTGHTATIAIMRTTFYGKPELWNELQQTVITQQRHEMALQWQQEVLGIPTLFTKATYHQGQDAISALSGLFYMRAREKMLIQLTCETADYPQAQTQLMSVLESLRTIDGTTPAPENPDRKIDPEEEKQVSLATKPVSIGTREGSKIKLVPGGNFTIARRDYSVRVTAGWSFTAMNANLTFTNEKLGLKLDAEAFSSLDSALPEVALLQRARAGMETFIKIDSREDASYISGQKLPIISVTRRGTDASGPRFTMDAAITNGDVYLLFAFVRKGSIVTKADVSAIAGFFNSMDFAPSK